MKSLYYSIKFRGLIILSRKTKVFFEKNASIQLAQNGKLVAGFDYYSPLQSTVLHLSEGSIFRVNGSVNLKKGVLISLASNSKLEIGDGTFINEGTKILVYDECFIGKLCAISFDVIITDSDIHSIDGCSTTKKVVIEDKVWIGFRSSIIKGAHIRSGAVIGCHSLVNRYVDRNSLSAGVPAKNLRSSIEWEM